MKKQKNIDLLHVGNGMLHMPMGNTLQYNTLQYNNILYSTIKNYAIQYNTVYAKTIQIQKQYNPCEKYRQKIFVTSITIKSFLLEIFKQKFYTSLLLDFLIISISCSILFLFFFFLFRYYDNLISR